jgi:hypothetical protein
MNQPIVREILSLGTDMKSTGEGREGIRAIAADAGVNWDAALREIREALGDDEPSDRCEAMLAGAVAGIRLASRRP